VKNVTGYDLAKLYTGSIGTLAIIAEISFKVRPQFGKTATAIAEFDRLTDALGAVAAIRKGALQPISCELAGPRHAVWVRFGEHPSAVDWQIAQLPSAKWRIVEGVEESHLWTGFRAGFESLGPVVLRVAGQPTDLESTIETYRPSSWIAHALNGIVLMGFSEEAPVSQIRERFPVIIERAAPDVRKTHGVFGVRGVEKRLMQDMKRAYDPQGRLNPGRHIDGE
jgi:FAD/FMN-containing dehydrogenase